ncbi:MAG: ChbG/HpnK family deacetylase [Magnetococcales bacterium]|nr:ChbG/HpnK family deacetylase [Magnetococcales bacterium]
MSPSPLRLIVNADDLGLTPAVNQAIFDLMARGRVTSSTLLVTTPAAEAAMAEVKRFPHCSFGVHLNLTYHWPVTRDPELAPLLNEEGYLVEANRYRREFSPRLAAAVHREWCAQVELALVRGVPVSHLDSHHHVHAIPALGEVLQRVAARFGLTRVRSSFASPPDTTAFRLTDGFMALEAFMERFGQNRLRPAGRIWELMTHPGAPWGRDSALLDSPWEKSLGFPVILVPYQAL